MANFLFLESPQFYIINQQLIEKYHLLPLVEDSAGFKRKAKFKRNLKDGSIEREIYGGMNAARVNLFIEVVHHLLKEWFPHYVQAVLNYFADEWHLTEIELIRMMRFIGTLHDCVRLGEGVDKWELESRTNAQHFFVEQGLPEKLAKIAAFTAVYKDRPEKLSELLEELSVPVEQQPFYHYLRRLICLADCIDIVRCVSTFQMQKILSEFVNIENYQEQVHLPLIIELMKQAAFFIHSQGDMLYDCKLVFPNENAAPIPLQLAHVSLATKVRFEHADDVLRVTTQAMLLMPYFSTRLFADPWLMNQKPLSPALIKISSNPFIHGTTTHILALLPKVRKIMGPVKMLKEFGLAPLSGERAGGGLEKAWQESNTRFGRLGSWGVNEYTLEKILANYTHFKFENQLDVGISAYDARRTGFSSITLLIIAIANAKQLNQAIHAYVKLDHIQEEINNTIQLYYLLLFLGKYIHPNFAAYSKLSTEDQKDICDAIYTHLRAEKIIKKIEVSKLNIQDLYESETISGEQFESVLSLLELPKDSVSCSGIHSVPKQVTLPLTRVFDRVACYSEPHAKNFLYDENNPESYFSYFSQMANGHSLEHILELFMMNKVSQKFFLSLEQVVIEHVKQLKDRAHLLQKIMDLDSKKVAVDAELMEFVKQPFPLLLISQQDKKIKLHNFGAQEYVAISSLEMGIDITMVATDTSEHRLILLDYFAKYHFPPIEVLLFDDLRALLNADMQDDEIEDKEISQATGDEELVSTAVCTMEMAPALSASNTDSQEIKSQVLTKECIKAITQLLTEYMKLWFIAKDRNANASSLIQKLLGESDINHALQSIKESRNQAKESDRIADMSTCFFKRNLTGSRYQIVLDSVEEKIGRCHK